VSETVCFGEVLLVGGGAIALQAHLPLLRGLPGLRRLVLFELAPARRREIQERFADDRVLEFPESLPVGRAFDLAVLATPPQFHLEDFQRLEPTCARFVLEKPMARDLADAEEIARHAETTGKSVAVHLPRAEISAFDALADLYRNSRYGALRRVEIHDGRVFDWPSVSPALFSREITGGGVLVDLGPHVLERLLAVFGSLDVQECRVDCDRGAVEANVRLELTGDGRVPILVQMSRNRNLSGTALFEFEQATCRIGLMDPDLELTTAGGQRLRVRPVDDEGDVGFATMVGRFYRRRVVEGRSNLARAVQTMRLMDRAYRIAQPFSEGF